MQPVADFSKRRRRLSSYSQLVHHSPGVTADNVEGRFDKDESPVTEEIPESAEGAEPGQPTVSPFPANSIPRGKDTGNMFHEILERLDFSAIAQAPEPRALLEQGPIRDLIEERMRDHRLEETWLNGVADVLWNTLHAKLPDPFGDTAFSLTQVMDYRPEMEFLFPYPAKLASAGADGYLGGFIDLVFRYRGRYYLLDWKSNHLEHYERMDLERSIQDSQYDLQYMLYSLALDKWLRSLIPDYDFATHFGGLYYIYLRGMRVATPSGIFAFRPTLHEMRTEFPEHLARVMAASGNHHRFDPALLLGREAGVV
jgi:exodeoxyribonuclease V beta subunit